MIRVCRAIRPWMESSTPRKRFRLWPTLSPPRVVRHTNSSMYRQKTGLRVAFLVETSVTHTYTNPARVKLVSFQSLTSNVLACAGVDNPNAFDRTRDPLLAIFSLKGKPFTAGPGRASQNTDTTSKQSVYKVTIWPPNGHAQCQIQNTLFEIIQ